VAHPSGHPGRGCRLLGLIQERAGGERGRAGARRDPETTAPGHLTGKEEERRGARKGVTHRVHTWRGMRRTRIGTEAPSQVNTGGTWRAMCTLGKFLIP